MVFTFGWESVIIAKLTNGSDTYGGVPEWPKGADCKSVVCDFGGSNPPSSTRLCA